MLREGRGEKGGQGRGEEGRRGKGGQGREGREGRRGKGGEGREMCVTSTMSKTEKIGGRDCTRSQCGEGALCMSN